MRSSGRSPRVYRIYGICLKSHWPLPGHERSPPDLADVELFEATPAVFSDASREAEKQSDREDWFRHVRLPDGSDYLHWSGLFEFLVSPDGRRIACRALSGASRESFQTYLLGQVLSFALLKQGIEPLHATTVVIDGQAVAFLGDCGYGKSSLGAAFLQAGYPLLTDDLLVLKEEGDRFVAYPGPPRIKLFPEIARSLLGEQVNGIPMTNQTSKLVIPLDEKKAVLPQRAFPLKAIYVLSPPARSRSSRITIRPLSPRRAFFEILKNTFNAVIIEPQRLERQFELATRLATGGPLRSLSYPRRLGRIAQVRESILRDFER